MYINSEGIIFRQIKTAGGRRIILLFTKKYGKISAGSSFSEKGRTKAALAVRPFTYGIYELYKNRDYYNINSADVKKSYFKIGEDVDKYIWASLVLELTEKLTPEDLPQPALFNLLIDFLDALTKRDKKYETLVLAYEAKALNIIGSFPQLEQCQRCGIKEKLKFFSIRDGGMICGKCGEKSDDTLIYQPKFDIVDILKYFVRRPMDAFGKIALEDDTAKALQKIVREYMSYYMDIGILKSEGISENNF